MITQTFMDFLFDLCSTVFSTLSEHLPAAPPFWEDLVSAFNAVVGATSPTVQYFLPIGPAMTAGALLTALVVALGFVKLLRRVVSLFTGGGGAS